MSSKVQALGSEGSRAATLAANGSDRLKELKRQLDAAHTQCAPKDRPLCDTIDTSSLEIIINFEMVRTSVSTVFLVSILNLQYPPVFGILSGKFAYAKVKLCQNGSNIRKSRRISPASILNWVTTVLLRAQMSIQIYVPILTILRRLLLSL